VKTQPNWMLFIQDIAPGNTRKAFLDIAGRTDHFELVIVITMIQKISHGQKSSFILLHF
jgi:hypothetical protein